MGDLLVGVKSLIPVEAAKKAPETPPASPVEETCDFSGAAADELVCQCPADMPEVNTSYDLDLESCEQPQPEDEVCNSKAGTDWEVHRPIGEDNGKVVYFLAAFSNPKEQNMVDRARWFQQDDIQKIREKGYTVIVDDHATIGEFGDILYDPQTAGIIQFAHGDQGMTSFLNDEGTSIIGIGPKAINREKVSPNLKFALMYSCTAGKSEKEWEQALGADMLGWNRVIKEQEVYLSSSPLSMGENSLHRLIDEKL